MQAFRYLLRVRYNECDAQGIVFNARWGDYVDIAVCEYARVLFGAIDAFDWRLVKQTIEWRAPGRFDDVLEARVATKAIGTTSFTLTCEFRRADSLLVTAETIYVAVDRTGTKQVLSAPHRAALERGAPGTVVDHAGART